MDTTIQDGNKLEQTASSSEGTAYLIMVQVASRALTFLANQVLLRHLSPSIFGAAAQLELYAISVVYFSRESIRVTLQRQPVYTEKDQKNTPGKPVSEDRCSTQRSTQNVVNFSYLAVVLGLPLAYILGVFYMKVAHEETNNLPFFDISLKLTGAAAFLELLVEPCFAVVQQNMLYKLRAGVETAAVAMKTVATCGIALWAARKGENLGLLPFAVGQMSYAITLLFGYLVTVRPISWEDGFSLLPRRVRYCERGPKSLGVFSLPLLSLFVNIYFQSAIKHILAQGDSMALATLSSLEDQGVYALASNYGSLVARLLFQPIEESSRNLFGKLLAISSTGHLENKNVAIAKAQFCDIVRAYGIFSILACSIGPSTVPLLLKVIIGSRWSSPGVYRLFSSYCYYIPFLAFNGVTESFVSATATRSELRRQTLWMGVCSTGFVLTAYLLLRVGEWGAPGIVWANIVNMTLRIAWSSVYIRKYFHNHRSELHMSEVLPSYGSFLAGIVASVGVRAPPSEPSIEDVVRTLSTGALCSIFIVYLERGFLVRLYTRYLPKSNVQKG